MFQRMETAAHAGLDGDVRLFAGEKAAECMGGVHDAYTGNTEFKKMVPLQIEAFRQVGPDRLHLQFCGGDHGDSHDVKF